MAGSLKCSGIFNPENAVEMSWSLCGGGHGVLHGRKRSRKLASVPSNGLIFYEISLDHLERRIGLFSLR